MNINIRNSIELYPIVPLAVGLIVGILLGENMEFSYHSLFSGMFAIVALSLILSHYRRLKVLVAIGHLAFFLLLGIVITKYAAESLDFEEKGDYDMFNVVVKTEPMMKDYGVSMDAKVLDGRMEGKTIRLYFVEECKGNYNKDFLGCCLSISARVRHPKASPDSESGYALYLKSHGISATATVYPGSWQLVSERSSELSPLDNLKIYFLSKRREMVERLRSIGMDGQAFAVTAAMAFGDKSEVLRSTSDVYSLAGTSHVLALSGLHLSIVFGLFAVFGGRWRKSVAMVVVAIVSMWVYVLLAGSPVSMIRSAIMLSVSILVGLSGRNGITLNTLAFSAIIILLANPFAIHDIGFQLSFVSVAFLGAFASGVCRILPNDFLMRHRLFRWCWQMIVTSLVAQLGTSPLVAYHFGRLPLYFLPANLIAIPAATIILYLVVAFFICLWLPWLTAAIGTLLSLTSSVLNDSMAFIAQLKYSSISIENMSIALTICLYIISIALLLILQRIRLSFSSRDRRLLV